MSAADLTIILPGYHVVEQLYCSSRTLVYRALKEIPGKEPLPVVVKLLQQDYCSVNELSQFRNQYTITKNLDIPGIVRPYALESYRNGYALVMEYFGGVSLSEYTQNKDRSLIDVLSIALQISDILHNLHQNRIIHKDIKPANILINPDSREIKLIDFSIASFLPLETQEIENPHALEGTLAYISPEQTGRMNRSIDYRSDFYSLGVTLYELITGELPFKSDDAMELVHCHIAKTPLSVNSYQLSVNSASSKVISDIVMKLMAKNAEDRYQSALGLKHDLEICFNQLKEIGKIEDFQIAQKDTCNRFIIPEKLYGREAEIAELFAAFNRMSRGEKEENKQHIPQSKIELILVAGFSGVGKTAVVKEVRKLILKRRSYFTKGKFDKLNRNIPFSGFCEAFRNLIGQLLIQSDIQLSSWKDKLLKALGENGRVIIDVIPELEIIIGNQPTVPELSGTAAQNRFNFLFQKFIQVFATKEHPLVIFLDDLQCVDLASLNFLQLLMSGSESGHLLLIGAYRDNEVSSAHPLMLTLSEIANSEAIINTITLAPLNAKNLNYLVADTLNCSLLVAQNLTEIVYQKTKGHPFFSNQFLQLLHQDGLIKFDFDTNLWRYDTTMVKALELRDDITEFMVLQLQKLPQETQDVLKLAACIGNKFDLTTLAIVYQKSETETAANLWKALHSQYILPQRKIYKSYLGPEAQLRELLSGHIANYQFSHDRIREACYSMIPEDKKKATHYHIGQLLLQQISPQVRESRIFELVSQLNYGIELISQQKERDELAQLNLIACRKAKNTAAYEAGYKYAIIGLSLLRENAWASQYSLSLALHDLAAELASLCGDFKAMEQFVDIVIAQARTLLEQLNVYRIRIQSNASQNKLTQAINIAKQGLQKLGVTFPETPTQEDIHRAIADIDKAIGDRQIEDLVHLPMMTDREQIAIVQIACSIMPAAYMSGSPLFPLLVALSVKLSIQYGNTPFSASAYAPYGIIACNVMQDVDMGVKFGELALEVVSKLDNKVVKTEIFNVVGLFILHRKFHMKETLQLLQQGYIAGLEVGNLEFVGYNANNFCLNSFWCAQPLVTLEQETRAYCNALVELNQITTANYCRIHWQPILNLLGVAEHPCVLSGEVLKEQEFLSLLIEAHDLYGLFLLNSYKLMLCYLFGEIESAQNYTVQVRRYLMTAPGTVIEPAFYLYDSLTALAALNSQSKDTAQILQRVEQNQMQLQQQWAHYAPMNHQHKFDLVEAEKHRILGNRAEAIELYDKAISGAKANEYIQEEALANELAAKFYLDWGKEKFAALHMQEAYYWYARWGAKAKTNDLEKRYPQLLASILQKQSNLPRINQTHSQNLDRSEFLNQSIQTTLSRKSISEALDFSSILKASQALSSEIKLEKLISQLMQLVMENAGAEKAALMLLKDNALILEAVTTVNEGIKLLNEPSENIQDIPITIVNYVKRSLKTVVLDNATEHPDFITDKYLVQQKTKSLLCLPILNQAKLIGLLYLENNLTIGAFTQNRVEIINLLITQAAISLENAQLYSKISDYSHTLEQTVEERTLQVTQKATQLESALQELQRTQAQLIQVEKMSGLGQLVAGIAHEINNPISFIYGNITPVEEYIESFIELFNLYQKIYPQSQPEIESKIIDLDLDFVIDDLPKLLASMKTGAERIKNIVLSLRIFSRLDEAEMKPVDIHAGIDSTLLMLQQRLTSNNKLPAIEVIKKYHQIPQVTCYASALNQVFINIINNAIDALHQKYINNSNNHSNCDKPMIHIRTSLKDSQNVLINIADNGVGISKSVLNKIFDPFFTTKPVGSGTGLGLSTSYSIVVDKHGGKLNCISTSLEGTEFVIELPLKPDSK